MLPIARVEPDNGYCLFFQDREEGQRFVAGRRVWVWPWWQSWKHVRLGVVEVKIHDLFTTGDNHYCDVDARFSIVVGGQEQGRESRLEKATLSCSPTNDIRKKVERSFFQEWATNHCSGAISRTLQDCTFIALLDDSAFRKTVSVRIKEDARQTLDTVAGLILVDGSIVIEPQEPKGVSATQDVLEKWLQFRRTLEVIAIQRLKDEHETQQKQAEEKRKHATAQETTAKGQAIELARIQQERDVEIASIRDEEAVKRKRLENERNRTIGEIQGEIDARDHESQRDRIRRESELKEEAQAKKAALEQEEERQRQALLVLTRDEEAEQAKHRLALQELEQRRLDAEGESSRKEAALLDVKQQLAAAKANQDLQQGKARAEVMKEEALARAADVIRLRELDVAVLPTVAELATRPLEKMGSITVHMIGNNGGTAPGGLSSLFTIVSTLPLVKECLRFVRNWTEDKSDDRNEDRTVRHQERPVDVEVEERANATFR